MTASPTTTDPSPETASPGAPAESAAATDTDAAAPAATPAAAQGHASATDPTAASDPVDERPVPPTPAATAATASDTGLRDADLVIVANRLPVHRADDGGWRSSPGGLVTALTPILQQHRSTWIGWTGADEPAPERFTHDGIRNLPVAIRGDEIEHFYEGFANRTLWPLYHDAVRSPEFRRRWWWPYVEVNRRFAEAAAEITAPNGTVWVHDYQLQLVPEMLRERRPDLKIGFFLHIPFPPQELFAQLPWRRQLLEGLLGADVIGFQTPQGAANFIQLARRFTAARSTRAADRGGPADRRDATDRTVDARQEHDDDATARGGQLRFQSRSIRVDAFPISIDSASFDERSREASVEARTTELRASLGDRRILLGVDRLDYTKGIDVRLRAFGDLLASGRRSPDECVFIQVAVPSRERVEEYRQLRSDVERRVGELNGRFGRVGRAPVHYLHRTLDAEELIALYRAADVMVVTPFRDGMNLVAKEYVASRCTDDGVLILSEFAGAAHEMNDAILVNPHDIDGLVSSMDTALRMERDEQRSRMRAMRDRVARHDVFHWSRSFLKALEDVAT